MMAAEGQTEVVLDAEQMALFLLWAALSVFLLGLIAVNQFGRR